MLVDVSRRGLNGRTLVIVLSTPDIPGRWSVLVDQMTVTSSSKHKPPTVVVNQMIAYS